MPTSPIVSIKYVPSDGQFDYCLADGSTGNYCFLAESLITLALTLDTLEWATVQEAIKNPYTFVAVK